MTETMYSAEEAARILGLQVRTVRNYVREGRLPGVRIGKQYRIARADLEAFTAGGAGGGPGGGDEPEAAKHLPPRPDAEASCVVQIEGIDADDSERLQRTLTAAALSTRQDGTVLRVEPLYDEERRRLKLIVVGSLSATAELLRVTELFSLDRP